DSAQLLMLPGRVEIKKVTDLNTHGKGLKIQWAQPVVREGAVQDVMTKYRDGDLVAHFEHVAPGEHTVCAVGLNGDLRDAKLSATIQAHVDDLAFKCEVVTPDTKVLVVEAPSQKRFD